MTNRSRKTIKDVAAAAGVSIGTASRALNRRGRVSEATVIRVTNAAKKLGYQPDAIAQSLRLKSTMVIGMLVTDLSNPFFAGVIRAAEKRLQQAGYALLVGNTDNESEREGALIDLFRRRRVDGLIMGPCAAENVPLLEDLDQNDVPIVGYDRDVGSDQSGLHVDHRRAAYEATRHLLNLGHERIALLSSSSKLSPGRERIAGYTEALAERGFEPRDDLIRAHKSSMDFVASEALSLMSLRPAPTAFLTLGTRMLAGTLQGLRQNGLRIPQDVSVLTVGDTDLARLHAPSISTVTWDLELVGQMLAELMLRRLDKSEDGAPQRIIIPTQLIERESCGSPGA
ncbi:LacI family DNA-binding transcriptional regulator [Arenibacterium halophilum]|uniref:LacI family transcriptional regulator n=1 Tax=Arenibacterium halophilum TaxID=2583821 RepID=A0ABY2X9E8_9RHOB|nr:LacI family DNA-binding transcriptional regulator [Arenibacterium halophilum]TMV12633.1 LacI family transcriptional regulator [Arenibacterium halophilum]